MNPVLYTKKPRNAVSRSLLLLLTAHVLLTACAPTPPPPSPPPIDTPPPPPSKPSVPPTEQVLAGRTVEVFKNDGCGCCEAWADRARAAGASVLMQTRSPNTPSVPTEFASCHTSVIDGFVFEGHVPVEDIRDFLANPPKGSIGLAVPGMPLGSPGMEVPGRQEAYNTLLLSKDGGSSVFRNHNPEG